eukprot:10882660-Alexandrium_andersonii.AAC.1
MQVVGTCNASGMQVARKLVCKVVRLCAGRMPWDASGVRVAHTHTHDRMASEMEVGLSWPASAMQMGGGCPCEQRSHYTQCAYT